MAQERQAVVEITVNEEKCRFSLYDPSGCKRCIEICPLAIFATRPIQKRDFSVPREQRVDPTIWMLLTPWQDYCDGCGACLRACETGALTITFDGVPIEAKAAGR